MKLGFGMMRLPRVEGTNDIDFEQYPEEHCIKAPELLHEGGVGEEMIHAICSHGYGHVDVKPEHLMDISYINSEFRKNHARQVDGVQGTDFLDKYEAVIDYSRCKLFLKIRKEE